MNARWLLAVLLLFSFVLRSEGGEMEKTRVSDFGLRGPVKQMLEKTTIPAGPGTLEESSVLTMNFSPKGWLLDTRSESGGGGPAYVRTLSYNDAGQLTKQTSGMDGGEKYASNYAYDASGHLSGVSSGTGAMICGYEYSADGKRKTYKLPKYEYRPDTAIGAVPWENSELQFTPPSEGTVTTIYDEKNRPKEGEVRDANGQLILRIARAYDDKGRITGDKVVFEKFEPLLPPEIEQAPQFSQLTVAQKKALMTIATKAFSTGESAFTYDDHDRIVEKRVNRGIGDEIVKTSYNANGDISEETVTRTFSHFGGEFGMDDAGNIVPGPKREMPAPEQRTVRYIYEYDAVGNWTKKTAETRSMGDAEFHLSMVMQRTLTYY